MSYGGADNLGNVSKRYADLNNQKKAGRKETQKLLNSK